MTRKPWRIIGGTDLLSTRVVTEREDGAECLVCVVCADGVLPGERERAGLIVRAVNAHDALVAALKACLEAKGRDPMGRWVKEREQAEAALALAEKEG